MSRLEELRAFGNGIPVTRKDKDVSIADVIDTIIDDIRKSADVRESLGSKAEKLSREEIGERVTGMQVRRAGGSTMSIRWGGPLGHGPLSPWVPHTCHKKIELCFPHPGDSGLEVCLEIEIPWPCNPPWPFPGPG